MLVSKDTALDELVVILELSLKLVFPKNHLRRVLVKHPHYKMQKSEESAGKGYSIRSK